MSRSNPSGFRKRLWFWAFFIVGIYLLICTGCASFQRRLIYYPAIFAPEQVERMAQSAKLERWTNSAGQFIGVKRPSPKQPAEGSVMIMYGNGSTATGSAHYADEIQDVAAFDVFILEYPGYEDRPGRPSQRSLFQAADEALRLISTNRPIYLVGESLGTGVASHLAATDSNAIAGMVLISPFDSLTERCAVSLSAAAGPTVAGGPFSLGEIPPTLSWPARRGRWRSRYRRTGKVRSASLP